MPRGPLAMVHNESASCRRGRYIGPGHMARFLEMPLELLDLHLEANVMAPSR